MQVMAPASQVQPGFVSLAAKTVVCHTITYMLLGALAFHFLLLSAPASWLLRRGRGERGFCHRPARSAARRVALTGSSRPCDKAS